MPPRNAKKYRGFFLAAKKVAPRASDPNRFSRLKVEDAKRDRRRLGSKGRPYQTYFLGVLGLRRAPFGSNSRPRAVEPRLGVFPINLNWTALYNYLRGLTLKRVGG